MCIVRGEDVCIVRGEVVCIVRGKSVCIVGGRVCVGPTVSVAGASVPQILADSV